MKDGVSGMMQQMDSGEGSGQQMEQNQMMGSRDPNAVPGTAEQIPDLTQLPSFAQAFSRAKSMGVGQFKWKRNMNGNEVYQTGLNVGQEAQPGQEPPPDSEEQPMNQNASPEQAIEEPKQKPGLMSKIFSRNK